MMTNEIAITIVFWVVMTLFFLALSIPLLRGKGAFLVAGVNTMGEQGKARYDIPKICKAVGALMMLAAAFCAAVGLISLFYEADKLPILLFLIVIFIIACIVVVVYANTACKK